MGRLILIEGLDLAGKSTLVRGLQKRLSEAGWKVKVQHGDLCSDNPVASVTREMMRWDPNFTPGEGAPLFLASHLWDQRHFEVSGAPDHLHLQDSCALRSLAFERVLGEEFYAQRLEEVVESLPRFDAAYVLTASISNRMKRFHQRKENDLHDHFMLSDPVRFAQVDSHLLHLGAEKMGAELVCTDDMTATQVLDFVWRDICKKLPDFVGHEKRAS